MRLGAVRGVELVQQTLLSLVTFGQTFRAEIAFRIASTRLTASKSHLALIVRFHFEMGRSSSRSVTRQGVLHTSSAVSLAEPRERVDRSWDAAQAERNGQERHRQE